MDMSVSIHKSGCKCAWVWVSVCACECEYVLGSRYEYVNSERLV